MNAKKIIRLALRRIVGLRASENKLPFCDVEPGPEGRFGRVGEQTQNRVLVITQPKAGTYMVAEILRQAGLHNTYLHLGSKRLQAYDSFYLKEGLFDPRKFDVKCGIEESRKLIRFGEVGVSHIGHSDDLARMLGGFKIVHIKRELRSAFLSWSRMLLHSERNGTKGSENIRKNGVAGFMRVRGRNAINNALSINAWSECANVQSIKLEEILSDPILWIEKIVKHVECNPANSPQEIWQSTKSAETLTTSMTYAELNWTDQDEHVFREIGGVQANCRMGYSDAGVK